MRFAPLAVASLLAVDPWGWDRFGPLRFALVLTFGMAAVAYTFATIGDRPKLPRTFAIGWLGLLASMALATVLSTDRWHSLIGTPDRHFGLITWLLCGGLFLAGVASGSGKDSGSRKLFVVLAAAFGCVGLYVLAEVSGVGGFASGFAGDRAGGPFGQPAFLGAACVVGFPISLAVALDRPSAVELRFLGFAGAVGAAFALLASQSRAAWVGLAVAAMVLVVVSRSRVIETGRKVVAAAALALIALVLLISPLRDRAFSLTEVSDGVVAGRIDEWQVGTTALLSSPKAALIGLGPETYRTEFGAHVDEAYVIEHGREVYTDRAHNGVLDVALAGGIVGLVSFAALLVTTFGVAVRAMRSGDQFRIGLGTAIVAYGVQQLALFPLAEFDPVVFALTGILVAADTASNRTVDTAVKPASMSVADPVFTLGGVLAGAFAIISLVGGTLDVLADHKVDAAFQNPSRSLELADDARSLRPDSIRYDFIYSRFGAGADIGLGGRLAALANGLSISPNDPALLTEQARLSLDLARQTNAPADLDEAVRQLDRLGDLDPNNPANQQRLGIALALQGNTEQAIRVLEHSVLLAPDDAEPLINLATALQQSSNSADWENACKTLARAAQIDPDDERIAALAEDLGEKSC